MWASGSHYQAPLAIEFYYDAQEEIDQVGFFDPTPRDPDGDNPATTEGEALRWILFQAAEELLAELDFDGMFPIRVLVTTKDNPNGPAGVASSNTGGGWVDPAWMAPGRLRARPAGKAHEQPHGGFLRQLFSVPMPAFEREAGTDACRARGSNMGTVGCNQDVLFQSPGATGGTQGWIRLLRDFPLNDGSIWRWDKNLHDRTGRPNIVNLIKHELMHVIGFVGPEKSQAYVATFDPPRRWLDRELNFHQAHGVWVLTGSRQHHYGPIASPSPYNPWRDTIEPGPRLQDDNVQSTAHLMPADGDDLAAWEPQADYMRPGGSGWPTAGTGIARDILADVGYARGTWSIQDRRLPRHWHDPDRPGHAIDMRRIERDGGVLRPTRHFLHFYTFDEDGHPEWYVAIGTIDDEMVLEGELLYVTYDPDRRPPQQVEPARSGTFRLDLDPAFDHPACADRRPLTREGIDEWLFATFEWDLPNPGDSGTWCLEPYQFGDLPAFPEEGSGSWFAPEDRHAGWGMSVLSRNHGPRPIIKVLTHYYDALGEPTWARGVAGDDLMLPYGSLGQGVEMEKLHIHGYCRSCQPVALQTQVAGTLRLRINQQTAALHSGNHIELLELTDQGPNGGDWIREDLGIRLISSPHPSMFQ